MSSYTQKGHTMLTKIKSFFNFLWEVMEETGKLRAEQHLRNHGRHL
jgi:hypothetical protein